MCIGLLSAGRLLHYQIRESLGQAWTLRAPLERPRGVLGRPTSAPCLSVGARPTEEVDYRCLDWTETDKHGRNSREEVAHGRHNGCRGVVNDRAGLPATGSVQIDLVQLDRFAEAEEI